MSSQFLTFIFIILVSVQLSSCGWRFPWKNDEKNEMSTEKSFKDDEPKPSTAAIIYEGFDGPLPKILYPFSDNNLDESISGSSVQPTITTSKNVPNEEFDKYPEEESPNPHNSGKETKSLPTLNTSSTDSIFNYVSSTTTQITDSSTPITEKYESESSTTANTTTTATTENTLNDNDVNNVPRNADEDKDDSEGSSSVSVSSSTIPSSVENSSFENEVVSSFSEFISPKVTYAPNDNDISSSIDEEKEPTSDDQQIGRKDKETHSSRYVTDEPDHTTQKISTENYESGNSSTPMTNTPTTTENMLNSTSVNEPRNVIGDTENSGNSSKSETVSDLDPSASNQANTTIETILSTSTNTMNTTEMAGSMSNGTTPEVNFGSFVNSGSTGNTYSQLILNLCILIFSISVIV